MTVTSVHKDPDALTMTITAVFDAPVERVWELWGDPRQLERWWGPPTYPATVTQHEFEPGGTVTYFMTGPEGDRHHGWWRIRTVKPPRHFQFEDGFSDAEGNPSEGMPTMVVTVTLGESADSGTVMAIQSRFDSREAMDQVIAMGAEEGMALAIGQIDDLLRSAPVPTEPL